MTINIGDEVMLVSNKSWIFWEDSMDSWVGQIGTIKKVYMHPVQNKYVIDFPDGSSFYVSHSCLKEINKPLVGRFVFDLEDPTTNGNIVYVGETVVTDMYEISEVVILGEDGHLQIINKECVGVEVERSPQVGDVAVYCNDGELYFVTVEFIDKTEQFCAIEFSDGRSQYISNKNITIIEKLES